MPEERLNKPSIRSDEAVKTTDAASDQTDQVTTLRRYSIVFSAVALASFVFFLIVLLRTGAWQMIVAGAGILAGVSLAFLSLRLARRGQNQLAGYMVLLALAMVYAVGELVWSQATPYLVASGALLILFAGSAVLPGRWWSWLIVVGYFIVSIFLINWFEPLSRFDVRQSPFLRAYVLIASALLGAGLIWQSLVAYRRVSTIRARLLVVSVAAVLLTAAAISAGAIGIGFRNGREQAFNRLELVALLREVEIEGWTADIKATLGGAMDQAPDQRYLDPEIAATMTDLLDAPEESPERQEAYDALYSRLQEWLEQAPSFQMVHLLDRDGTVLVSSDSAMEGLVLAGEVYFERGTTRPFVAPLEYVDSEEGAEILVSRPLIGEYGRLLGVLVGRVDPATLDALLHVGEAASLGDTGETYLVDADHQAVTAPRFAEPGTTVQTVGVERALAGQEAGSATYTGYQGNPVVGVYRQIPDLDVVLLAEQSRAEALRAVNRTAMLNAAIAVLAVFAAGAISLLIAQDIGGALSDLADAATDIAAGNLDRTAEVERGDEIGTLADAFNTMTARLRGLIGQLEQRVAERTQELQTRSAYLQASAEVGQTASTMLNADQLIQEVVDVVRDRFDLYYVGLFILDEMGEWAELRAGTGGAGRQMLAQDHRLLAGGESMIGQCVATGEARIALDVGEEAVRFDNPLLPETRSEAALPLQSRGRMFGAMTVQSEEAAAFDEDTVTVLQTMADQVAVALDNAYLFAEAQSALEAARRASGEVTRRGWSELLRSHRVVGYHADERGVMSAEGVWRPEMEQAVREGRAIQSGTDDASPGDAAGQSVAVPIKVAGKVIGVLHTHKSGDAGSWTDEEIETLESLSERLGISLETARLYEETRRRAERERLTSEISSQVWSSADVDTILRTAVRELGRSLRVSDAWIELESGNGISDGGDGDGAFDAEPADGGEE